MLRAAWRFRRFLRPYRLPMAAGALMVVAGTVTELGQPWPLKVVVDGAIHHHPQSGWLAGTIAGGADPQTVLLRSLVALAVLTGLSALFSFGGDYFMSSAGQRMTTDIRNVLYSHLQRLSLAYHDSQRVGDLAGRVTMDIDRVQQMLVSLFDTLIPNGVMLVGLAVAMLVIDPVFGLLALSVAPLLFVVTYRYTRRIKRATLGARRADADVAALASETLAAVRWVQAFTREEHEERRFLERNSASLGASLVAIRLKAAFSPTIDIVSLVGTIAVTYLGARRVMSGDMSLGILLVFLAYVRSLYRPMRALSKLAYVVTRGTVSAERVDQVLSTEERITERPGAVRLTQVRGEIELRDVTFRYEDDRVPVLSGASLRVEPGEHVGIVGRTGSGKSTMVSLIPRFYDPQQGAVLLDGIDVRDIQLSSLREQVSLVLQEPILFYGSLLDNILYGSPGASSRQLEAAVVAANVDEFADQLPDRLLTQVGERGVTLSGGQRQRVAIARAMLRDAPILILDEPTTGLDADTEQLVLDALHRLATNRTTLVISHHATVLTRLDRLVRVESGHLVEIPTSEPDAEWRAHVCPALSPFAGARGLGDASESA